MSVTLWDTNGSAVVQALIDERRSAGALASGLALSLVVVVDEARVREAEQAAMVAAAAHPCRLLIVIRHKVDADIRLDAEVQVGGRLGPTEAVIMRMYGRLALHAESVVLPLLAPDAPVVTWWHGAPPDQIATDALGVLANRRITDCAQAADPLAALGQRAADFLPGDTDLAWTRCTPWRALLAAGLDGADRPATGAVVEADEANPSAALIAGWLHARLGVPVHSDHHNETPGIARVQVEFGGDAGTTVSIERPAGKATAKVRGYDPWQLALARRDIGDLLAEELRRMDPDVAYAESLAAATGVTVTDEPGQRVLVWRDPAQAAGSR
ncbi:MAG TPA: glucose-6-phosphate dehydrogenase assembly protein OpcA [Mycobacteriales bacterium]|nr:glucose-6-phosphate dehydrogenase assembly protein OpcA [Mycobacteriales bacterium]